MLLKTKMCSHLQGKNEQMIYMTKPTYLKNLIHIYIYIYVYQIIREYHQLHLRPEISFLCWKNFGT